MIGAPRAMCVLATSARCDRQLSENQDGTVRVRATHPQNPEMGTRKIPFSRVLYIERDDFMENPPKKISSPRPGTRKVRLRNAYVIKYESMVGETIAPTR